MGRRMVRDALLYYASSIQLFVFHSWCLLPLLSDFHRNHTRSVLKTRLRLFDFILPRTCLHCRSHLHEPDILCVACLVGLVECQIPNVEMPGITPEGRPVWSCWYYRKGSPLRSLHRVLKFEGREDVGRWVGTKMASALRAHLPKEGYVVPMPSHRVTVRERGLLHTLPLAQALSMNSRRALERNILKRRHLSISQSTLGGTERLNNVAGAFECVLPAPSIHLIDNSGAPLRAGREPHLPDASITQVVLVDDLMTTGHTLDAAASALEKSGCDVMLVTAAFRREAFRREATQT